jgi:hypothetical protein
MSDVIVKYMLVSSANSLTVDRNTLSFLKRNINISNPKVNENAYTALVRPTMEYACTTWDPYQQNNRHSLEMHLKSDDIVTPRYVADVTCSSWCPCDM